jgi:hypothetical protein
MSTCPSTDSPIRVFHGEADDQSLFVPCRDYVAHYHSFASATLVIRAPHVHVNHMSSPSTSPSSWPQYSCSRANARRSVSRDIGARLPCANPRSGKFFFYARPNPSGRDFALMMFGNCRTHNSSGMRPCWPGLRLESCLTNRATFASRHCLTVSSSHRRSIISL